MRLPARLVFVRHAIAVEREEFAGPDEARPLTKDGIAKARPAFDTAFAHVAASRLLTSPLVRARQTAELVRKAVREELPDDIVVPELAPESTWREWSEALVILTQREDLGRSVESETWIVVGHEPSISLFFGRHLGLEDGPPFKKAAIGIVEPETLTRGRLIAFLPPRFLR